VDAGLVSGLRSQTIYHALAYAKTPNTPDTIILDIPKDPYVCVGFHRDVKQEVDIAYCTANKIPIIRRETGGGTVYIDENQLFVQWIFGPESLPKMIDPRFQLFIKPLVETYQAFDINAQFFPPNDVHVKAKKIVGTGAAALGLAEVVTGNFLFDFDCEAMAKVLKVPNETYREAVYNSLQKYMTSMTKELGSMPDVEELKAIYIEKCATALERKIVPGDFTDQEYRMMEVLDEKYATKEWLYQYELKQKRKRIVKIHADVWMYEISHKIRNGTIDLVIRTKGKRIDAISIKGDIVIRPAYKLKALEKLLHNVEITEESLSEIVMAFYWLHQVDTPGIVIKDWVEAIMQAKR